MRFGITFRLNLIVLLTVLLLGGGLGAAFVVQQDLALRAGMDWRIRLLGEQVAAYVGHVLPAEGAGRVGAILDSIRDPEIAYVLVKRADGAVIAERRAAEPRGGVREYEFPIYATWEGRAQAAPEAFGVVETAPGSLRTGTLALGADLAHLDYSRRLLLRRVVGATAVAALAATLLGVLFVRFTLRRSITPLLDGIRGVASGDLARRVPAGSSDEIDDIGRVFNEMADRLAETLVTKGDLEATVERRTAELRDALEARRRAQDSLAEREARVRLLLESTAESIFGIATDGSCTFVNAACVRALGYGRPEELIGRDIHALIHHSNVLGEPLPSDSCLVHRTLHDRRGRHSDDEQLFRADGTRFPVEIWSYPMFRGDAFLGAVVTFIDLTDRRRLEGEVLKVRKLESLGVLAGGIAHDFNNLLMGILGNLTLAREEIADPAEAGELLREAERATLRARQLTQQLLTFSRGGAPVKKVISVRPVIEEASRFALSGSPVRGEQSFPLDLWPVAADAGQLGQVIHNLVINAVQAMPQGGQIRIACDNVTLRAGEIVPLEPGRYVRISVEDHGAGIPAEHIPRLFDPYFSTKSGGHGLGLATVYSIARRHGGHVTVASTPGLGTTFEVYLPAEGGQAPVGAPADAVPSLPQTGRGRVLVMDDELSVRKVAALMLTRLGYEVETVADGASAVSEVRAARERGKPFDVLLMDLTVPGGMGGVEALGEIRGFEPEVVCIATSGYSNDPVMARFADYGFAAAVAKPYTLEDLGEALRGAAASNAPPPA